MIACQNISKSFNTGGSIQQVLSDATFSLASGETCVLVGPSGSGKTTLLSILGCLLSPTSGDLQLGTGRVDFTAKADLIDLRRRRLGFVFQHAQLLPFLTIRENLEIVARNAGLEPAETAARLAKLAATLGFEHLLSKRPMLASGGERQRVAIARALIHNPQVILADEPTAALDWGNGEKAIDLLIRTARENGIALLVVTHDQRLLPKFDRVIQIEGGRISE